MLRSHVTIVALAMTVANCAFGQHTFTNTKTVDPSGSADFTDIQSAIDSYSSPPTVRSTILVYAGDYAIDDSSDLIHLDGNSENIDIVGVDRDAVIIRVNIAGSGIKITSGTETSRNNSIRNLTIKTSNGAGIEIVKGGTPVPSNIKIEGVTIGAAGTGQRGITGVDAINVRVFDSDISTANGHGIEVGDDWTLEYVSISVAGSSKDGLRAANADGLTIRESTFVSDTHAGWLAGSPDGCTNVAVHGTTMDGGVAGMRNLIGKDILFLQCHFIGADALFIDRFGAVPFDPEDRNITALACRLEGSGGGLRVDAPSFPRVIECDISAVSATGQALGVWFGGTTALANPQIFGGSIRSSSGDERETTVFDIDKQEHDFTGDVYISGTRFSKWRGPIESSERPRIVIQRTVNVKDTDVDGIAFEIALEPSEQILKTGFFNPDVYRVLTVQGTEAGMSGSVFIIGTDFAGNAITEQFTLSGTAMQDGVKPFKAIDTIIVPPKQGDDDTVNIGWNDRLGLEFPISSTSALLQLAKQTTPMGAYTFETITLTDIDAIYSTMKVNITTDGNGFEFTVLASQ